LSVSKKRGHSGCPLSLSWQYVAFVDTETGFENENTDEYDPEAGTILPRLQSCKSSADALRAVHEEFVRWFGADTAGPQESYGNIASEIWQLWVARSDPRA
jgi:hypothetical protein